MGQTRIEPLDEARTIVFQCLLQDDRMLTGRRTTTDFAAALPEAERLFEHDAPMAPPPRPRSSSTDRLPSRVHWSGLSAVAAAGYTLLVVAFVTWFVAIY